jgi:hypothetical protein
MAIAVIGGLLVSTVLSLLFVPAFFVIMDDLGRVLLRIFGRFIGKADEPTPDRPEKPLDAGAGQRGAAEHPSTAVAQTSEPAKAG